MTMARRPNRARFLGVRESPHEPPIHALDTAGSQDETVCGIEVDPALDVVGDPEPFLSAAAIAEMLNSNVPPCPTCRDAVVASSHA